MSRTAAKVTQADVSRILKAAQAAGPGWRVKISLETGEIELVQGGLSPPSTPGPPAEPVAPEKEWRL